jgi:four helix bundle protein
MKMNAGRKGRSQNQDEEIRARSHPSFFRIAQKNRDSGIGTALLRSGTSVGAHYREATQAKSDADFISKIEGALQELEESEYWLDYSAKPDFLRTTII